MPSAAPDGERRARFTADLAALLNAAGLPSDASLGIALSGGPDSCALLLLARQCATGRLSAMTVDHGLRADSTHEARAAAALCDRLGVAHETARVEVGGGSVQAAARAARYGALGAWAGRTGIVAILTAHHADDQAETLLMRLARGAGLAGLAGVRAVRPLAGDIMLLRPLLAWRKTELEAVCDAAGIMPAIDPSNADPRYDRTGARALLAATPWLDAGRIAASAAHLAEAEAALATIADQRYATLDDGGGVLLRPDPLREIARRHLRRLLAERFDAYPDGPSLERTIAALVRGGDTTCADISCRVEPPYWRLCRAPPRRAIEPAR